MVRALRMAAYAASFVACAAMAQAPAAKSGITDLAYSVQAGNSLYFTGKYQGKPVNLVRNGAIGSGKWTIYTGTLTDRVRLTIDDTKGLQEVLAMDKGHRMTLNQVGQERIEYRLYAPDRRFVIGSVLYRNNKRWLQGIMKTEAFAGYPALIDVSDVTGNFAALSAPPATTLAGWLNGRWQRLHLIPPASAADLDSLIKGFFSDSAQEARARWSAPAHEMFKGSLAGAAAFTAKVIERGGGVGYLAEVAEVAVALPFIQAVVIGVGVGLVVDKGYRWAEARNLGGTTSARDLFDRLVGASRFSNEPAPEAPQPMVATSPGRAAPPTSLLDMADKLDKLDKLDFIGALDEADSCTRARNFSCSETQIGKAAKLVNGARDQQTLALARQNLAAERKRVEDEIREAERVRVAEQERIRRQEEAQARAAAAEQDRQQSAANMRGLMSILGATATNYAALRSQASSQVGNNILADSQRAADDARANNERRAREARQQQAAQQTGTRPAANKTAPAPVPVARPVTPAPQQATNGLWAGVRDPVPAAAAQSSTTLAANTGADQPWRTCGPKKTCLVGDGYQHYCSGPPDSSKPMCKSECSMDSLVIYHDTTLPPGNYMPGNGTCPTGTCNVVNSCD